MSGVKDKKKRAKFLADKKRKTDKNHKDDQFNPKDKFEENCENQLTRKKKRKNNHVGERATAKVKLHFEAEDGSGEQIGVATDAQENEKRKSTKKKRENDRKAKLDHNDDEKIRSRHCETQSKMESSEGFNETDGISVRPTKSKKKKKKNLVLSKDDEDLFGKRDAEEDDVYQISSGDEDFSKGMRKWIREYHQSRPGLNILQERIDDFITAHEAQEEQERKEREARAAEDGWTVVVHHKGRKKTTDAEAGISVGSVAHAAVLDKMAEKKNKEVGLDFYRFQRREAQRNEIMMLQNKFEQDKKRIQQLRAARKFRPH